RREPELAGADPPPWIRIAPLDEIGERLQAEENSELQTRSEGDVPVRVMAAEEAVRNAGIRSARSRIRLDADVCPQNQNCRPEPAPGLERILRVRMRREPGRVIRIAHVLFEPGERILPFPPMRVAAFRMLVVERPDAPGRSWHLPQLGV